MFTWALTWMLGSPCPKIFISITTHLVAYWSCVDKSFIKKRVAQEKTKHGLVLVGVDRCFVPLLLLQSNSHQGENCASSLTNYLRHICAWKKEQQLSSVGIIIKPLIKKLTLETCIYEGFQTRFRENPGTLVNCRGGELYIFNSSVL